MKTIEYWTDDKDGYLERNKNLSQEGLIDFFSEALPFGGINSVCEYGCNIGLNLEVLKMYYNKAEVIGYDLNPAAVEIANKIDGVTAKLGNLLELPSVDEYDLVLTKGLLIHIHPDDIEQAYQNLYFQTKKYLLICEYYNPFPVEVEYHGKSGLLFKRDFAGEMLKKYPDLRLVKYGFRYHLDKLPQDDITYFLLRKE